VAAGVILVTLLAANIGLPLLTERRPLVAGPSIRGQENNARLAAAHAAINALHRALNDLTASSQLTRSYELTARRIRAHYHRQIETCGRLDDGLQQAVETEGIERRLRILAWRAERDELFRIGRSGRLSDELTHRLVREVDLQEARFESS
jgi:monovalent cation/hydrogen antiporter